MEIQQTPHPIDTLRTIGQLRPDEPLHELLHRDHERLERLFDCAVTCTDPIELADAWAALEEGLLRHLSAEEVLVLPRFARRDPAAARRLLREHADLRERLLELGVELDLHALRPDQVRGFVDALREHARREDAIFYPFLRELPADGQSRLRRWFLLG
jgi:hemerythrin superfamily protein